VGIIGVSLAFKNPFEQSVLLAFIFWFFIASFAMLLMAFSSLAGTLADDHSARVLGLIVGMSMSLGIAFVFAGIAGGLASAAKQFDWLDKKPGNVI